MKWSLNPLVIKIPVTLELSGIGTKMNMQICGDINRIGEYDKNVLF